MAEVQLATLPICAASNWFLSRLPSQPVELLPSVRPSFFYFSQQASRNGRSNSVVKGRLVRSRTPTCLLRWSPLDLGVAQTVNQQQRSRRWDRLTAAAQAGDANNRANLRTCRQCKQQFDPETNHPRACKYHTAHYGGETRRKFESVYEGGTLTTPDGGKITAYWHCCGNQDPADPGCEAAPHRSYDD